MKKKICKKCNLNLPLARFETKRNKNKGKEYIYIRGTCRKCMNDIYTRNYVQNNKEKVYKRINEYTKKWWMKQKAKLTDYYIIRLLKQSDSSIKITPKLIEIKRDALLKKRNVRDHILRYKLIKNGK